DTLKKPANSFPVACNVDNVEITKAEYVAAEDYSWEAIDIHYSRGDSFVIDRIFKINPAFCSPRSYVENDTAEAAYEDQVKNLNTQLYSIARNARVPVEELQACDTSS